jgi:hypothetical protein
MKLIREILYEKFSVDADPVHAMGIGEIPVEDLMIQILAIDRKHKKKISYIDARYSSYLEFVMKAKSLTKQHVRYLKKIVEEAGYLEFFNSTVKRDNENNIIYFYVQDQYKKLIINGDYRKRTRQLNEKFEEVSDPVKDLGVGIIPVYYYFYISTWAANILIDFKNPNHIKLLEWLQKYSTHNNFYSAEIQRVRRLCKKAGVIQEEDDGSIHVPEVTKESGPDIMLRVASTNDVEHLFDKGVYQEWVWNFNSVSLNPEDHFKRRSELRGKIKESLYEKFSEEGDPIKDLQIGHDAQMAKLNVKINWDLNPEDYPEDREVQIIDIITYKKYEFETKSHSFNQKPLHIKVSRIIHSGFDSKTYEEKEFYFATSDVGEPYEGKELEGAPTPEKALAKEKKWLEEYFDSM